MCVEAVREFPCGAEGVASARRAPEEILQEWGLRSSGPLARRMSDLVLVAAELANHTARENGGRCRIHLMAHRTRLRVGVTVVGGLNAPLWAAGSAGAERARQVGTLDATASEHGLLIVQALADEYGVERHGESTSYVWAQWNLGSLNRLDVPCHQA